MGNIKPISTKYNGITFRSRLEARWAVFFDACGEQYMYEYEGYDLGENIGWYLPDFYLPRLNLTIEIKGPVPTSDEAGKLGVVGFSRPAALFHGVPGQNPGRMILTLWPENPPEQEKLHPLTEWIHVVWDMIDSNLTLLAHLVNRKTMMAVSIAPCQIGMPLIIEKENEAGIIYFGPEDNKNKLLPKELISLLKVKHTRSNKVFEAYDRAKDTRF